jgi:hypothetical protein
MFHFDGKQDTYNLFFNRFRDAVSDIVFTEFSGEPGLIFGSDEEKAMVNAVSAAFPSSKHLFCARHIEENVRHFLTDIGVSVKDRNEILAAVLLHANADLNSSTDTDHQLAELMERIRIIAARHQQSERICSYVEKRILPKLRNNIEVGLRNNYRITKSNQAQASYLGLKNSCASG